MSSIEIREIVYQDGDPFPSLIIHANIMDGPRAGERLEHALSLVHKSATTLKRFFNLGGADGITDLDIKDGTNLLIEPNLEGLTISAPDGDLPWPFADAK